MQAIGSGCTSVELGSGWGSPNSCAKTAATLEDLGFITRVPSPTDGRERLLVPTQRGSRC